MVNGKIVVTYLQDLLSSVKVDDGGDIFEGSRLTLQFDGVAATPLKGFVTFNRSVGKQLKYKVATAK